MLDIYTQQVQYLYDKGVRFNLISKEEACYILSTRCRIDTLENYLSNFTIYQEGKMKGKYIKVDFQYLLDLHDVDISLRNVLFPILNYIESQMKVQLINRIYQWNGDSHSLVKNYIHFENQTNKGWLIRVLNRNIKHPSNAYLLEKYGDITLLEPFIILLSFGKFTSFYKYCADYFSDKTMNTEFHWLLDCVVTRNACAHGLPLLLNLEKRQHIRNNITIIKGISSKINININDIKRCFIYSFYTNILNIILLFQKITNFYGMKNFYRINVHNINNAFNNDNLLCLKSNKNILQQLNLIQCIIDKLI